VGKEGWTKWAEVGLRRSVGTSYACGGGFLLPAQAETILTTHVVQMQLDLSGLPELPVHASGFSGKDSGDMELYVMALVDAVFGYRQLVWMLQMYVLVVLLDSDFSGNASLPNVNLTTFAGMLCMPGVLSSGLAFTGQRKLIIFLGGKPTDLMCVDSILLMQLKVV
jgi:hypothetical protein